MPISLYPTLYRDNEIKSLRKVPKDTYFHPVKLKLVDFSPRPYTILRYLYKCDNLVYKYGPSKIGKYDLNTFFPQENIHGALFLQNSKIMYLKHYDIYKDIISAIHEEFFREVLESHKVEDFGKLWDINFLNRHIQNYVTLLHKKEPINDATLDDFLFYSKCKYKNVVIEGSIATARNIATTGSVIPTWSVATAIEGSESIKLLEWSELSILTGDFLCWNVPVKCNTKVYISLVNLYPADEVWWSTCHCKWVSEQYSLCKKYQDPKDQHDSLHRICINLNEEIFKDTVKNIYNLSPLARKLSAQILYVN